MLDLKELERRLDEALAKETTETLSNWILDQRKTSVESFFGHGSVKTMKEKPFSFHQSVSFNTNFITTCNNDELSKKLNKAA